MSIPIYPKFSALEINDTAVFDRAFEENPPLISEFTFTNLYAWRRAYALTVSFLDNLLIIGSASESGRRFFEPIGKGDKKAAVEKIMHDTGGIFFRISEGTKALFDNDSRCILELDRDNSDYLYTTVDLVNLNGKKYDGKRNLIRKFKSEHAYEYLPLTRDNVKLCLDFEETWCFIRNCDSVESLDNERQAIKDMVENFSTFWLIGGAILINGVVRAFAFAQKLNPRTLVNHVLKADPHIPGLYQTIMREFLVREAGGFQYVNLEQDLGVDGLRKAKLSYHPCAMVNKYILKLA
jgi:hypothetical protein